MADRLSRRIIAHRVALAVFATGLAISVLAFDSAQRQVLAQARRDFEEQCAAVHRAFEARLRAYSSALKAVQALYDINDSVSRDQFRSYVSSLGLSSRFPAIKSINFAQHVSGDHRESFEAELRREWQATEGAQKFIGITPPGTRDEYHVLLYSELTAEVPVGLDIRVLKASNAAGIELLRDSGEILSSGELVKGQPGNVLALRGPVYRLGMPRTSVEERRLAFHGTVGMGFSLEELARELLPPAAADKIRMRLAVAEPVGTANVLFDTDALRSEAERTVQAVSELTREAPLSWGGKMLSLRFDARMESFASRLDRSLPYVVLVLAMIISMLAAGWTFSIRQARVHLESRVRRRTRQYENTRQRLELEMNERTRLERQLASVCEEERMNIGRELHDDLGQRLNAIVYLTESLSRDLKNVPGDVAALARKIQKSLVDALYLTRFLARGLHPLAPDAGGLDAALERLAAETQQVYGLQCRASCSGAPVTDPTIAFNLFRITQEAVNNAVKHAGASRISIELRGGERPALTIEDDGLGMNARPGGGMGLQTMKYRAESCGLNTTIRKGVHGGTVISVG